jgi:hypothetical protein
LEGKSAIQRKTKVAAGGFPIAICCRRANKLRCGIDVASLPAQNRFHNKNRLVSDLTDQQIFVTLQ